MSTSLFHELHARSAFSFLRGANTPEQMVRTAAELGLPGLALLDRDGVYGAPRLFQAAREAGIRALVGAELTVREAATSDEEEDHPHHHILPLLVASRSGYQNLCRMITRAKLRGTKVECHFTRADLEEFQEGLIALTGDEEGALHRAVRADDRAAASRHLEDLIEIYGRENIYVELRRHRAYPHEEWINCRLLELAEHYYLPVIASNGPAYAKPSRRLLMDAFHCLRNYTTLDQAGPHLTRNAERHLKSGALMAELFADLPQAIENTARLADRLDFTLENLGYQFPRYPVPPGCTMEEVMRHETYEGARRRYGTVTPKVRKQLDHELALINKLGFPGYFLVVWDLVNYARRENILVQGRGSAANSAVCYCLGITAVDPIASELLFERFLSEGRNTWPDIDLDLPSGDQREKVIQHVFEKFGPLGAAMTANVITYRGRSAMREMGKVLGISDDVLGRFSDLYASGDFPHTLQLMDQIERAGLPRQHPRLPALVRLYEMIHGLPRHLGQHSGGMVFSDRGLDGVVPLEHASMPGRKVVQWDKDDCEDLGIIKVDLLGLGMMAAIEEALELCQRRGRPVDLARIPKDDPPTYEMMQRADTIGVFQIESRAQMATLPRMKPKCFYDIVIEAAIIRPGPIVGNMVHPYLNRRSGKEKITYIDPRLEPVLKRTLGVPLFQEQVLRIAMIMADFSGSEAEELRRALSFNRSRERMDKVMTKLRAAMDQRSVRPDVADEVVQKISSFALYGFPESHAISFALLAYASAWLKVHRPAEFYVGLLNHQPMGFYSSATLVKDAKDHGLRVRPVSVMESAWECTVEADDVIRLGLLQVKGLSDAAGQRILEARAQQPFASLEDFMLRVRMKRDERRVLAKTGALNGLAAHRRDALWEIEQLADPEDLFSRARLLAGSRKNAAQSEEDARQAPSILVPMNALERLEADYEGLNLTTGKHPVALLRHELTSREILSAADLQHYQNGDRVRIAGMAICRQRPGTAKGHVFISLEDETGISNAFVPSATFEKYRLTITQEPFLIIYGRLQIVDGVTSIYTWHVEALPYRATLGAQSHDFH